MYYNPYSGVTFFGFLWTFFQRVGSFLTGHLAWKDLAADEIQVLVLVGVAASSALVGTFLVLRKMTMLANSLSHTILLGIVAAYLITRETLLHANGAHGGTINIQAMLIAALCVGLATTFLTEFLTKTAGLQEDASTGIVFTSLFALGIMLVTLLTRSAHIGTEVVMGNVDGLVLEDSKLVYVILLLNLVLFFLFFKEYKFTTFDPGLARAFGLSMTFYNYLLMCQVSATAIGAFRAVGVLMFLAFITGPVLAARLLTDNLKRLLILSVAIGSLASLCGVALSRHILSVYGISLSTGGIVVCTIVVFYLLALLFAPQHGLISKYLHHRDHRAHREI